MEVLGEWFEGAAIGRVGIEDVLQDLFEVEDVYFVILSEDCQRPRKIILTFDFLGCDIS